LSDRAGILVCYRANQTLLNAIFMTRLNLVLMEKRACGILRSGGCFGRYFCIWRCQNRWDRPNDRGNIVEEGVYGFHAVGMVRFHQYLSFHLDFQLRLLLLGLKMSIFGQRCKVLSSKELCYGVPTLIEVQGDPSVSV